MYGRFRTWFKIIGGSIEWKWLGVALSLSIIAAAAFVLFHILHDLDLHKLEKALRSFEMRDILIAGLSVAAGYITLTFYDLFALRAIGRDDVPYRIAALAGFTSYAIGHNVGASVFSGGAGRYPIYSAWGLDAIAVAKNCFFAGLTFWLGNATVLGLGISLEPEVVSSITQLPAWANRLLAIAVLLILTMYVSWVWIRPRVVGRSGWQVALPGGPLTLLQIGIGI